MKKILNVFVLVIFCSTNVLSEENNRDYSLRLLFDQLKKTENFYVANKIEMKIWDIWITHPTKKKFTTSLAIGSDLMLKGEFQSAHQIFSTIVESSPDWAEAWNKRATVLYLMGEYKDSLNDIGKVLKLESRHFGALSGQALIQIKLKNYEQAINSYKEAQKIYPSLKAAKIMILQLQELINEQVI